MDGQYIDPMLIGRLTAGSAPARAVGSSRRRGWAWPRQCELCRGWSARSLCDACLARLAPPVARCGRCALPLGQVRPVCADCLREVPPFVATCTLADYSPPWDTLITAFKFHDRPELAGVFAPALADRLSSWDGPPATLVLPVPLSAPRLAERGHNQAWELARRVAPRRGLPADASVLQRLRDTPHQVGLSRQARSANMAHAFWVPPEQAARLAGQAVALVDDVLTTGTTAAAASRVLLQAGAASVQLWVLARTPAPGD
jgi:ComF family protein